ncbi:MAG TPA: DUF885 domain-containing protein [Dehalococcoidia bacterium]|nr:DUF885 domain-containing protein [Dehalococcoidia bacterium]
MPQPLERIVQDYVAATNAYQPGAATARGFHEHDGALGDRSARAIDERQRAVRGFLQALETLPEGERESDDAALLRRRLQWEITEHEEVRAWQRSPGAPLATIGGGCNGLAIRDFAPADERLRSLVDRLRAAPALLEQAKANLRDPSRWHVETALESAAGMRALFDRDLPAFAQTAADAALQQEFAAANADARAAVEAYADWLRTEMLPRASDQFAWGPETFRKLLQQTDSVDEPLDVLIARGEEDLKWHQQALAEVAARIDAGKTPAEVVDAVAQDHPAPAGLLPSVDSLLESLREFSVDAGLCTMPTEVRIGVTETPGFSRMTTQAACSPPGPFETKATAAYYYVTPPEADWPAERVESYMRFFNRWTIPGVTAHEAYPGHYVHLTYLHRAPSVAGRYLMTTTTVEGWAHYIEQVMIEAGYGEGDPRLHLMQIREALLRLCRYRCAFGLHAEGWPFERAVDFFVREGYSTPVIAERETRRGVLGPNYYAYTLGKHQILELRERLRARDGARFDLRRFHDQLMQQPYPVSTIARRMTAAAPA